MARLSTKVRQDLKALFSNLLRLGGIGGMRDDAIPSFDFGAQIQADADGTVPASRCKFSVDAANNDDLRIGGHIFKFVTALGAADTFTQVKRGVSLAATQQGFIDAVNGVTNANVVPATTPFALAVYADLVDATHVRVRQSTAQGQVPGADGSSAALAPTSIVLAENLTQAGDTWSCLNLNCSGSAAPSGRRTHDEVVITAQMLTYGSFQVELPFTPAKLMWNAVSSTGVLKAVDEAVTISGNAINLVCAGGGGSNWAAGDKFRFLASE